MPNADRTEGRSSSPGPRAPDVFGITGTTQCGSYHVERSVAEGGFAVVYRALLLMTAGAAATARTDLHLYAAIILTVASMGLVAFIQILTHHERLATRAIAERDARLEASLAELTWMEEMFRAAKEGSLDAWNTPVLYLHGEADPTVNWEQGLEWYNALRFLGKPIIWLSYPDEGHGLSKLQNRIDFQYRLQDFFDHHLKGAPAPSWMTDGVPYTEKGRAMRAYTPRIFQRPIG